MPRLDPLIVIERASPPDQLICVALLGLALACLVIGASKLSASPALAGGSQLLSAARLCGPLLGLLGAAWATLRALLGLANLAAAPSIGLLAPALAEATLMLVLGLAVGVIAVSANWAVEARIDREVLKA